MVLRLLLRILANNEQLVQRLSESYPIRRAAQLVVRTVFKGKDFIQENNLHTKLTPEQFRQLMRTVAMKFQLQIKQAQEEMKRKMQQK